MSEKILTVVKEKIIDSSDNSMILIGNHDGNDWYDKTNHSNRITKGERFSLLEKYNCKNVYFTENNAYGYKDIDSLGIRIVFLESFVDGNTMYGYDSASWGYTNEQVNWLQNVALNTSNEILILSHMCFSSEYCGFNPINGTQMKEIVNNFI